MSKWKRTVEKLAYVLRSRDRVAIGGDNAIEQIFHWLEMQDGTLRELSDRMKKPFKCSECSDEFFSAGDLDLHRVDNHWEDEVTIPFEKSQETICDEHKAKYFEDGYEAGQADKAVDSDQTEVIVVFDSKLGVVSFSSTGVDPRKGTPDIRGVVPSMSDWAAQNRRVPIVDDPLYGPPVSPSAPYLRCDCGASYAHEMPSDWEMHGIWAANKWSREEATAEAMAAESVKGNDPITIELACQRVLDYMTGHFSSATIEGVLSTLRGHQR